MLSPIRRPSTSRCCVFIKILICDILWFYSVRRFGFIRQSITLSKYTNIIFHFHWITYFDVTALLSDPYDHNHHTTINPKV
jgi:hypothetical protein